MSRYPKLPNEIRNQLGIVEPTGGGYGPVYYPCAVTLKSGDWLDCVYICEAKSWYRHWGIWPDKDSGKKSLDINEVGKIEPSPSRLPSRFANHLYNEGESGMGYTIFTVEFKDGSNAAYGTGNAVDFISYPAGKGVDDVENVIPHIDRQRQDRLSCPDYYWCLYSE